MTDWKPEDDGWLKLTVLNAFCDDCSYAFTMDEAWMLPCPFHAGFLRAAR